MRDGYRTLTRISCNILEGIHPRLHFRVPIDRHTFLESKARAERTCTREPFGVAPGVKKEMTLIYRTCVCFEFRNDIPGCFVRPNSQPRFRHVPCTLA